MRKEIYLAVADRLMATGEIRHVDLWNRNVEFIEDETFDMPAVFVEFQPIIYKNVKDAVQRAQVSMSLHVVTRMAGITSDGGFAQEEALAYFDLIDTVHRAVHGLSGEHFSPLVRIQSHTNDDQDEIIENLEVYECMIEDNSACCRKIDYLCSN